MALDRGYRAVCAHGIWWAFLEAPAGDVAAVHAVCPECGPLTLTSREPPASESNGRYG